MIAALALAINFAQQQPAAPAAPGAEPVPEVLVERRLAEMARLRVGDTVRVRALAGRAAPAPFVVAGVFEREADPNRIARNELELRFHLPDLQRVMDKPDRVDRFAVVLRRGARAD